MTKLPKIRSFAFQSRRFVVLATTLRSLRQIAIKEGIVFPPRPTYTPEPEFSEQARHAKYQGTVVLYIVVDKAGKISRIRLERALGMGLDENAMEGVKRWRFNPATRNGEPVAVAMNIEVSFNLY
jgi:protein TonB